MIYFRVSEAENNFSSKIKLIEKDEHMVYKGSNVSLLPNWKKRHTQKRSMNL